MKVMRRSRWLARLAATLVVGVAGLVVVAWAPAQAGIVFQSNVMAAWGHGLLGDGGPGRSLYGDIKAAGNNVVQVAAGWYRHHLTVRSDGTVWAWGRNDSGQLGDGTTTGEGMPVQVTGLTRVTQVAAGYDHSLALRSDGTVWAWGNNNHGQLGNGTSINSLVPAQVPRLTGVTKISAGYGFSLALRSDGTVWAWGWNDKAQLGAFSTSPFSLVPVQVPGLSHATGISAGFEHAVATATNGTSVLTSVWAWGGNEYGQLGDGTLTSHGAKQVTGLPLYIASISAGDAFTTVLGADGAVWAWGYDTYGQLGNAPSGAPATRPVNTIGAGSGIIQLSAGGVHVLALKSNGTVLAWGKQPMEPARDRQPGQRHRPGAGHRPDQRHAGVRGAGCQLRGPHRAVPGGVVEMRSLRVRTVLARLRSDGTVWAWGNNDHGQLGNGTTVSTLIPVKVTGLSHVTGIAAGFDAAVATATNGTSAAASVWTWGANDHGQLGDGTLVDHLLPERIGGIGATYIAGLRTGAVLGTDGSVWGWGDNSAGQLARTPSSAPVSRPVGMFAAGSRITQLSAGWSHMLALKSNGTVLAWGFNASDQLGIGNTTSPVGPVQVAGLTSATQVSAGVEASFAVHTVPYLVGL